VASFAAEDHLFFAHPGGGRLFKYVPTTSERRTQWQQSAVADDHASLLAAILAQPDDDNVRLVYADFLEENGDPNRAELIRLQCEIAEQERRGPVRGRKVKRAWELQRDYSSSWLASLPALRGVQWREFWRGFPVPKVESTQTLIRIAKELVPLTPIEAAEIYLKASDGMARLAKSDVMPRLRILDLRVGYGVSALNSTDLAEFTRSPRVSGLRGLNLSWLEDEVAGALAVSPYLSSLEWLRLPGNQLTEEGATALAESPHLPALRWIDVTGQQLSEATLARLKKRFRRVVHS
jgi:uncharacterized protein (TIGR02996 family)